MHPVLFEIGNFKVGTFGLLMATAFLVGIFLMARGAQRIGVDPNRIVDACLWTVLAGVIGARTVYVLLNLSHYLENPNQLLTWRMEGLTSFGGFLFGGGMMAFWAWRNKIPVRAVLDIAARPFLIASAIGRIGCFLNGCCYGSAVDHWPPGVHFVGIEGLHHPAQLYEMAILLVLVGVHWAIEKRGLRLGQAAGLAIVFFGLARFIYEFWRVGATAEYLGSLPITQAQAFTLVLAASGFVLIAVGRSEPPPAGAGAQAASS